MAPDLAERTGLSEGFMTPPLAGLGVVGSVGVGLAVWAMMRTGRRMSRVEGSALLVAYAPVVPLLGSGWASAADPS